MALDNTTFVRVSNMTRICERNSIAPSRHVGVRGELAGLPGADELAAGGGVYGGAAEIGGVDAAAERSVEIW